MFKKIFWYVNRSFNFLYLKMFWHLEGTYSPRERKSPSQEGQLIPKDNKKPISTCLICKQTTHPPNLSHSHTPSQYFPCPRTTQGQVPGSQRQTLKPTDIIQTGQSQNVYSALPCLSHRHPKFRPRLSLHSYFELLTQTRCCLVGPLGLPWPLGKYK